MVFFSRLLFTIGCCTFIAAAQDGWTPRERALLDRIDRLEKRVAALETQSTSQQTQQPTSPAMPRTSVLGSGATGAAASAGSPPTAASAGTLGGIGAGTTMNLYLDGYYGYNFNSPVGRVNLLHASDVLSNNFTLNQMALVIERAPDVAAGRRFGARVDLMFGQNTETLQGSPANEPRPQVYRNLFQAYGSYVFPVGSGLTVDFGKFYSSLGFENNYGYDEINYSRSFYFSALPFYHMGFRTTYNVNDKLTIQHWLVNGQNQTEDFNGFKSNAFLFTIKLVKSVSWNVNYYFGEEGRELVPNYNLDVPALPTQPGLSVTPVFPTPNGRTHIFDTYASWSPNDRWTVAGEFDTVVSRNYTYSAPVRITGGIGYLKYQFTPKFNVGGRFEYLGDYGGLFSGVTQALKEGTATATYQPADGVQMRLEWRRDFSNRRFFLTDTPGLLSNHQDTATLGMIWWFGGKRESW